MEEFNADSFFDKIDPNYAFVHNSALTPDLTSNASQDTSRHPSTALCNDSLSSILGIDLSRSTFRDSFETSTGMIYVLPYGILALAPQA
jgi:hypothetical protein